MKKLHRLATVKCAIPLRKDFPMLTNYKYDYFEQMNIMFRSLTINVL